MVEKADYSTIAEEWFETDPGSSQAVLSYVRLESKDGFPTVLGAIRETALYFLKAWLVEAHFDLASHTFAASVWTEAVNIMKERTGG